MTQTDSWTKIFCITLSYMYRAVEIRHEIHTVHLINRLNVVVLLKTKVYDFNITRKFDRYCKLYLRCQGKNMHFIFYMCYLDCLSPLTVLLMLMFLEKWGQRENACVCVFMCVCVCVCILGIVRTFCTPSVCHCRFTGSCVLCWSFVFTESETHMMLLLPRKSICTQTHTDIEREEDTVIVYEVRCHWYDDFLEITTWEML